MINCFQGKTLLIKIAYIQMLVHLFYIRMLKHKKKY